MNDNPLKQYFRRPSIYIRLPSGGDYYNKTDVDIPENGELAVYPMTAIDEVTSRTPDALFNGQAVVDIIKSCVPAIKDPWKINNIDLDVILMAIRVASSGEEMDIMSTCPNCTNDGKYGVSLVQMLGEQKNINYGETLKIRDLIVKFKPLTYTESNKNAMSQYEIQKMIAMIDDVDDEDSKIKLQSNAMDKLNTIMYDAFGATIESVATPETLVTNKEHIIEFLKNCDRQTSNAIKEKSIELREKNRLKPFNIMCSNCKHEYSQQIVLNITDFFV